MRTGFRHGILRNLSRMVDVSHVHYMHHAAHRNALAIVNIKDWWKHFVTNENVILVTENRVRSREPAVAVKFMMIKAQLADELRVLRAATLQAIAHVENYQAIAPISEISQTIFDLHIMQVATNNFPFALSSGNRGRYRAGKLPARYFFRMLYIGEVNHTH